MGLSRRTFASGRTLLAILATSIFLRRSSQAQPAPVPGSISTLAFATVAAMRAFDVRQVAGGGQLIAEVAGYNQPGDGGGGAFEWLPGSTALDDTTLPGMVPVVNMPSTLTGMTQGRWVRRLTVPVFTPEMAGAVGDGKADDFPAFDRLKHLLWTRGGGTIRLSPDKYYRISAGDLVIPNHTVLEGSHGAIGKTAPSAPTLLASGGIVLDPRRTVRLDYFAEIRGVAILREGLAIAGPASLEELRSNVEAWAKESGSGDDRQNGRSIGITIDGHEVRVSNCLVIGFHTALYSKGFAGFLIERLNFDCANGIEITDSRDISRIRDCHANQFWSANIGKVESLYRPGIGYNFHDSCDGLIVEDSYATGFRIGWRLSNVWSVTLRTPAVEGFSPDGGKTPVYGFVFENIVVQTRVFDAYADMGIGGVGLQLMHADAQHAPAAWKNKLPVSDVTFIGGSVGSSVPHRPLIICGPSSRGQFIGTTFEGGGPNAVVLQRGIGPWRFIAPIFGVFTELPWLQVTDPADWGQVYIAAGQAWSPPNPAASAFVQTHINETMWIAADGALAKHDGTPSAPLTVQNTAPGNARNTNIALARVGASDKVTLVGSVQTDGASVYYNTASDYRLKTIVGTLDDPWPLIERLHVHLGHFDAQPETVLPLLLAHEVQEVAPYAVTGEKDAVDDGGQAVHQQLDVGKLTPLILAALVSQCAINQDLERRVAAVEASLAQ
jgi:hypothetical protein